jgi:DNA mismatch repair protein MutS
LAGASLSRSDRAAEGAAEIAPVTPMMVQYLEVKANYPGFLLFYRMGDFFELFFDDAVKAAEALGIQLTKRGRHAGEDIPMCGVPAVRAGDYLHKLIRKGFRVAIAEQLEDPEAASRRGSKTVLRRDVVRLVTPGTLTEEALLVAGANNFLTALARNRRGSSLFHLASLDISTGEFFISEASAGDLEGELLRLRPAELLIADGEEAGNLVRKAAELAGAPLSPLPRSCFSRNKGERALKEAFEVASLEGLGFFTEGDLTAIGALLHYVNLTQMGERPTLRPPKREAQGDVLLIDAATRASLELVRPRNEGAPTVFSAIDRTVTAPGARELMARLLSPSTDVELINERLDAISALTGDWALRDHIRKELKALPDLSRALSRIKLKRGGPRDLGALRDGLAAAERVQALLSEAPALPKALTQILAGLRILQDTGTKKRLVEELRGALGGTLPQQAREGGFIADGYDPAIDGLRELATSTKTVLARLQSGYVQTTGIRSLKIQYNQILGYFVEVSQGSAQVLQTEPHSTLFRHKQTLANAVRFTTEELSALEARLLGAAAEASSRELVLFDELCARILAAEDAVSAAAGALAGLDCTAALAELAHVQNYARPRVDESRCFLVEGGRHPSVEQALSREGKPFIGNDCKLDGSGGEGPGFAVVTGPNMAGKSTYLRQNALIAVLAQSGSFVPAASAHIGAADRLFARIGAADDLARGQSTFMVEMTETAAMLNQSTSRSFVILDEIGRGTATFDGLSIAWAVLEHLHDVIGCRGLVATHYHELTRLAEDLPRAANVRMKVAEWRDSLVFLHAVEAGAAHRSYGVQAAKLAGLPKPVLTRARQVLAQLENGAGPHGPLTLPTDMPLFASPALASAGEADTQHPVLEKLAAIDADALSPREALDALYGLKSALSKDAEQACDASANDGVATG